MSEPNELNGIVLKCTRDGAVSEVLQDTLGITAGAVGRPFADLVAGESVRNALGFLDAVRAEDTSYNWGVYVGQGGKRLFLHVTGYALNGHIVIIGATSRVAVGQLYHRTLRMHHDQLSALKKELGDLQHVQAVRERDYLDYVEKLNGQVRALQESLARKESETPPAARSADAGAAAAQQALAEQRALVESLRQSEAALSSIFRASPVALFILSRETGALVNMSDSFERAAGASYEDLVGKPIGSLLTQAGKDAVADALNALTEAAPARELTIKFRRRDGELRDGVLSLRLLALPGAQSDAGKQAGPAVLGALEDYTDSARVNQALNADLHAAREQNALLADELRQREYQFTNRLGSWNDPVDVSKIELNLYQQREQEMRVELESLRRAESELTQQVTDLQAQLASLGANAARYQQLLAEQAPLLRDYATALENTSAGWTSTRAERDAALAERQARESALNEQIVALRTKMAMLEMQGERYKRMLAQQAPLLLEQASLLEQLAVRGEAAQSSAASGPADAPEPAKGPTASIEAVSEELSRQQSASRALAGQLATVHQLSEAQQSTLAEELRLLRERAGLVEIELGRRLQRQHDLSMEIESLKASEAALHAEVLTLQGRLAERDALLEEQSRIAESLREQLAERERAAAESSALLAAARGNLLLRELEIDFLKSSEQKVEAQGSQLHNAMRALELRLKRVRHGKEDESERAVPPRPTSVPEHLFSVPALNAAEMDSEEPVELATEASWKLRQLAETEQALRLELSTMHQKEQGLVRRIAELDRQVRLLEWQRDEQGAAERQRVAWADSAGMPVSGMDDFIHLMLEMIDETHLLGGLVSQFATVMGAPGAYLLLWDATQRALLPREAHGLYEAPGAQLPVDPEQLPQSEPALTAGHALAGAEGTFATLSLPLSAAGQTLGMLLLTYDASHQFGDAEVARGVQMAREFALALRMARTREQEQRAFSRARAQGEQFRQVATRLAMGDDQLHVRLARLLQSGAGENLTLLSVYLEEVASGLPPAVADDVRARVRTYQTLLEEIGRSVRDVITELHPPLLEEDGLLTAIRWFGMRFSERTGVPTTIRCDAQEPHLEPTVAKTLFRITQETLTNMEKPDPAYPVRITLNDLGDRSQLTISGGEAMAPTSHWEQFRLKERAEAIGGQMRFESAEGQIMRLVVEVANR